MDIASILPQRLLPPSGDGKVRAQIEGKGVGADLVQGTGRNEAAMKEEAENAASSPRLKS